MENKDYICSFKNETAQSNPEKAVWFNRQLSVPPWIMTALFSAVYCMLVMLFLDSLYSADLLLDISGSKQFVYFFNDIFDVFWLLIAAIPNGIITVYFLRLYFSPYSDEKFLLLIFSFIICIIIAIFIFATATEQYNDNQNVWSAVLKKVDFTGYLIYSLLELISAAILTLQVCTFLSYSFILARGVDQKTLRIKSFFHITNEHRFMMILAIYPIIFLAYFLMMTFSNLSTYSILHGNVASPYLFQLRYYLIAPLIAVLFIGGVFTYHADLRQLRHSTHSNNTRFIIGSIVIPVLPIIIQVFQIITGSIHNSAAGG